MANPFENVNLRVPLEKFVTEPIYEVKVPQEGGKEETYYFRNWNTILESVRLTWSTHAHGIPQWKPATPGSKIGVFMFLGVVVVYVTTYQPPKITDHVEHF